MNALGAPFRNEPPIPLQLPAHREKLTSALAAVRQQLGRTYPLLIGGEQVDGHSIFMSTNPAHPNEMIGRHVAASTDEIGAAVEAAEAAFPAWSAKSARERASVLWRTSELILQKRYELDALLVLEVGKSWEEADGEIAETVDLLRWYAGQMLRYGRVRRLTRIPDEDATFFYVPLGVGAIISPWNFPFALTTGMLSAAIVAGNAVVVKPASTSPTSVAWLAQLFSEAGLPAGVLNYVTGPGDVVGDALVDHPRIRFIAFTGSRDVGVRIHMRAAQIHHGQIWLKRTQLEMGGKNAVVVDETADLDAAAKGIVDSAFGYQGQKCSAGSRAIVVRDVYQQVIEDVVDRASKLRVGDPSNASVTVGPLIDEPAHQKVTRYVDIGQAEGRMVLGGGKVPAEGWYVPPTVFVDVAPESRLAQEEIFGPVLAIIPALDFDDAIRIANGTEYGLTGSLYTRVQSRAAFAGRHFHVGNLYINRKCTGALMGVHPFGGFNMSGTDSKAGGPDYLLFFLQGKAVGKRWPQKPER